ALSIPPPVTDWETYGGITRPVRLIAVPATFVDDAWVRLTDRATIAVDVALAGPRAKGTVVRFRIPELKIDRAVETDANGRASFTRARPPSALWWSPDRPTLYNVEIVAGEDVWRDRIGFRTIETDG